MKIINTRLIVLLALSAASYVSAHLYPATEAVGTVIQNNLAVDSVNGGNAEFIAQFAVSRPNPTMLFLAGLFFLLAIIHISLLLVTKKFMVKDEEIRKKNKNKA